MTKKDQPDKLREYLAGKALAHIPVSIKNIDKAWELLKEAFGDPMTLLNNRMQAIRSMKPITDKNMNERPLEAVDWILSMERCITELLSLGDRGGQLSFSAFGPGTISQVIRLLPDQMENKIIRHMSEGRDKLIYTVKIMADRRRICSKRGVSYANQAIGGAATPAAIPPPTGHLSDQASSAPQSTGRSPFTTPLIQAPQPSSCIQSL